MCWGCVIAPVVGGGLGNTIQEWTMRTIKNSEKCHENQSSTNKAKQFVAKILLDISKRLDPLDCAWKQERPLSVKLSAMAATSALTFTTSMIIKNVFHISFCGANGFSFGRAAAILVGSTLIGTIYSLGISALLNRYVPVGHSKESPHSCCTTR